MTSTLSAAATKLGLSLSPEKPAPAAEETVEAVVCKRPTSVHAFVGQDAARTKLAMMIKAAKARGELPGHCLFAGPPGLGKSSLAEIVAHETGGRLVRATASAVRQPKALGRWLAKLTDGDVAFIDEIHGMPILAQELLNTALEDRRIEVIVGEGTKSDVVTVNLANFVLVGATTKLGRVSGPIRDRFALVCELEYYTDDQLAEILLNACLDWGMEPDLDVLSDIARRSRGTARVALNLLRKCRDFAAVMGDGTIDQDMVNGAMELEGIDSLGLTDADRRVLTALCVKLRGGPVGRDNLAATSNTDVATLEDVIEPNLIRHDLLVRAPRGRRSLPGGFIHLGLQVPPDLMF